MRIFLIGHRGTGKTSLLHRYQIYGRGSFPVFDLDREIENKTKQSIEQIFSDEDETTFRKLEHETLQKLIDENRKMVCALGAGFDLSQFVFPSASEIIWVRRGSDPSGRIFLNRPRLNSDLSSLQEYQERFIQREPIFAKHADWIYLLPEGLSGPDEIERHILGARMTEITGCLTLKSEHFRNQHVFCDRTSKMGLDFFELRNDLLNASELQMALEFLPAEKILISIRKLPIDETWKHALKLAAEIDWPLELGPPNMAELQQLKPTIVSLHETSSAEIQDPLFEQLAAFEALGVSVKWCPIVNHFSQIDLGLRWQSENPESRNFLPRSTQGRWSWVRLLLKGRQKINFVRDGDGSAWDQPTLHEWMRVTPGRTDFAAVLGSPIKHSYSPLEHQTFFREREMNFFAIELADSEWDEAVPILLRWGLRFAAVTSPLKQRAFGSASHRSPEALEMHSANTLTVRPDGTLRVHNTDLAGFQEMMLSVPDTGKTVIWGGGGTLPVLHQVLPEAQAFSVRTGQPRDATQDPVQHPETVVWAAAPNADFPPLDWRPRQVLDLNYREDSLAREYAKKIGASYVSGHLMFHAQASAQQEEWEIHG